MNAEHSHSYYDELIRRSAGGDEDAQREFFAAIESDIRETASRGLHKLEREGGVRGALQTTVLVDGLVERFIRLKSLRNMPNVRYFYKAISDQTRKMIIDRIRYRNAQKRSGVRIAIDDAADALVDRYESLAQSDLLDIEDGMERLKAESPESYEVVQLRFWAGRTYKEIAEIMGITASQAENKWRFGRAKLKKWLTPNADGKSKA